MKGSEAWALVSWCPGFWPGFPVASRSQCQLGWAESFLLLGGEPSRCPAPLLYLPSLHLPSILPLNYPCSHPPATNGHLTFLIPHGPLDSLGPSSYYLGHRDALRNWVISGDHSFETLCCALFCSNCFRGQSGLPGYNASPRGLSSVICLFPQHLL